MQKSIHSFQIYAINERFKRDSALEYSGQFSLVETVVSAGTRESEIVARGLFEKHSFTHLCYTHSTKCLKFCKVLAQ